MSKQNKKDEIEVVSFSCRNILGSFQMRENNFQVELSVKEYGLDMVTEYIQTQYKKTINILRPNEFDMKENCFKMLFENKPLKFRHIDKSVDLDI